MLYALLRPLLFRIEPERAHKLALDALSVLGRLPQAQPPGSPVELMGLRFPNRIGLAAGFDKQALAVDGLGRLGFGFIEVGTVTPVGQAGQPRPRLFRLPHERALINRLGFPNDGAAACAGRLARRRYPGIVGVNIGKNATTPLDEAAADYVSALRDVHAVADYVAINVSSPNTAALRDLHRPQRLAPLLQAILTERARLRELDGRTVPLLLKISPDLEAASLRDVATVLGEVGLDGVIATNTTVTRPGTTARISQTGGLSGVPLQHLALQSVATLRELLGPDFPIIGAGGVDSLRSARAMRVAGADLVQIYTGFIYRGPALVRECSRAL
jgi:dihydroorotate dehydrogenase